MKLKPIHFNTEMVRAILDGRKTVTRRIIKPQPRGHAALVRRDLLPETTEAGAGAVYAFEDGTAVAAPFTVGDVLYVRETWGQTADLPGISEEATVYAADFSDRELAHLKDKHFRWRPSIHMPKELARLYLKVTDVRAERLQNMRLADVLAEGIIAEVGATWEKWCNLWDSTIPKEELAACGWKANPWVWVIRFEVCEKPRGGWPMKVTVELDISELKEFMAWREDRDMYKRNQLQNGRKIVRLAEKVMFAIEIGHDDEHYIIADQDHLDELAEMAMGILDD